jgi:hypothetical protein
MWKNPTTPPETRSTTACLHSGRKTPGESEGRGQRPLPEPLRGKRRTPKAFLWIGQMPSARLRTIRRYSCSRAKLSARPGLAAELVETAAQHLLHRPGAPGILRLQRGAKPLGKGRDLLVLQVFMNHEGRRDRVGQVLVGHDSNTPCRASSVKRPHACRGSRHHGRTRRGGSSRRSRPLFPNGAPPARSPRDRSI